uniref:SHH signaling and ciliosis regulator SDCCAG8 n=1 Tax=Podarcis muralis TaxID=64176 RepID=A0A670ICP3_PODMU
MQESVGATERAAACSPRPDWGSSPSYSPSMREAGRESGLAESLERCQQSLHDRATKSYTQLKYAFGEKDLAMGEGAQLFSNTDPNESENKAWQELQHNHAVNQLKALLRQQEEKETETSPSRRRRMSPTRTSNATDQNLPALCDLISIINDQSQYINHLEAEVKFCKEDLSELKSQICTVVLENEKLHDKLEVTAEHTLREQTLLDASGNTQNAGGDDSHVCETAKSSHINEQATAATFLVDKWQLELENLKCLYQEQTEALEAQVLSLRKELSESQKKCEDLSGRLKHQHLLSAASSSIRVGGLCLQCAQHEAVLSQTHSNVHMQTIERLTKSIHTTSLAGKNLIYIKRPSVHLDT